MINPCFCSLRWLSGLVLVGAFVASSPACSSSEGGGVGSGSPTPGSEGGECRAGNECDTGLDCVSDRCVDLASLDGGGSGGTSSAGTSSGGTSNGGESGSASGGTSSAGTSNGGESGSGAGSAGTGNGGDSGSAGTSAGGSAGKDGGPACNGVHPNVSGNTRSCDAGACLCVVKDLCYAKDAVDKCCPEGNIICTTSDGGVCMGEHPNVDGGSRTCDTSACYCSANDTCYRTGQAQACCPVEPKC